MSFISIDLRIHWVSYNLCERVPQLHQHLLSLEVWHFLSTNRKWDISHSIACQWITLAICIPSLPPHCLTQLRIKFDMMATINPVQRSIGFQKLFCVWRINPANPCIWVELLPNWTKYQGSKRSQRHWKVMPASVKLLRRSTINNLANYSWENLDYENN